MKPEILVLVPIYAPTLAALEREYAVRKLWTERDPEACLRNACANVRGIVTTGLAGFTRAQIEALPALEIIACFGNPHGTGSEHRRAAAERGIVVTNTPDAITATVADLAAGLILSVMRRIPEGDRFVRAGKWETGPPPPGRDLGARTCAIVGLGSIGRAVATRMEVFGMSICYHGPRPKPDVPYPYHSDLAAMARLADCLVVTCPLTSRTRCMINARVLQALGPDGFLVNVARGPVVDEEALIAALQEKRIAGAALDVYWDEPRVPPALKGLDNVVMTPHIGSTTREIREERGDKLLANLRAHFAGERVPYRMQMPGK